MPSQAEIIDAIIALNYSVVDPDNARLWKRVVEITNTCQCIEPFVSRNLIDPQCAYHEFSLDIFEALRDERDHWRDMTS